MKQGHEYIEEMIGMWYFVDKYAENEGLKQIVFDWNNVTQTPESMLQISKIEDENKLKFLNNICATSGKKAEDYLIIKGWCPYHGNYEVFRPNDLNARYDNIFCPKCIQHEQLEIDCTRPDRNAKHEAQMAQMEAGNNSKKQKRY